jgi:hypothetical protein
MIRPMRVYGPNVGERVVADVLLALAWALIALAILSAVRPVWLGATLAMGGACVIVSLPLFLAAGGVRQNRGALTIAKMLLLGLAAGWIVRGLAGHPAALATGIAVALASLAVHVLWRQAVRLRFKPRFFTVGQFETMIQIADVMLEGEEQLELNAVQVAVNVDHFLSQIRSPALRDLHFVLVVVEYVAPLLTLRPVPFSRLGTAARRSVVERAVFGRGPFRDVARSLKLLACAGYYCAPEGMASVGFVPFDDRARSAGVDRTPAIYPLPVIQHS